MGMTSMEQSSPRTGSSRVMLQRENTGEPPVCSDFDPLHQAGRLLAAATGSSPMNRNRVSAKEAYHVAKNFEEIRSNAIDPEPTKGGLKSRSAAVPLPT